MKIRMVAVISQDGYITDGTLPGAGWASDADKKFFADIKAKHSLFVMGSKTYNALPKPLGSGPLRIVLTHSPEKYTPDAMPRQLEFHTLTPSQFTERYREFDACLLLGGSHVYTDFLDSGLVDEIYLTIENTLLGMGTPLLQNDRQLSDILSDFTLHETILDTKQTKILHYILKK